MSEIPVIQVSSLSKIYHLYNNPRDRFKEALHPLRKKFHHDFYALKDVSFEVRKGETMGIIGQNGSGKSTLLKILSHVLTPTSGQVMVNGKVSSLLELGTGFNPELTGIENVYFNGTLLGFTKITRDITDRKRAEDAVRHLSGHILRLQDEERRRIAREEREVVGHLVQLADAERRAERPVGDCRRVLRAKVEDDDALSQLGLGVHG